MVSILHIPGVTDGRGLTLYIRWEEAIFRQGTKNNSEFKTPDSRFGIPPRVEFQVQKVPAPRKEAVGILDSDSFFSDEIAQQRLDDCSKFEFAGIYG